MKKKNKKSVQRDGINKILNTKLPFTYTEAYKALRTNIEFVTNADNAKRIIVASSLSGEGKTCLSINLAISLAQTGKKVLLLDCDLRKPKVHRYLRIKHSSQYGVSTVLAGTAEIDNAIGYLDDLNLYVMLAGPTPPNPSELLNGTRCEEMFDKLSERFDYIICDTAPIAIVTDAVALSQYCDGVVFVIRQNYATSEQINEVITTLRNVNTKIFGAVLNGYNAKTDSQSNYGYQHYYNYYYGSNYSETEN